MNRFKVDKKMIAEIRRSPTMSAEQGPNWLSAYGGPQHAEVMAGLSAVDRDTYYCVAVDGITNVSEIAGATGRSEAVVNNSLTRLNKKGLVSLKAEPIQL